MAGKIIADQIEHSTAGSIATNYVVNGSAKAWVNFNGDGTPSIRNSLNTSSLTDVALARYETNFASSFNAADYTQVGAVGNAGFGIGTHMATRGYTTTVSTSLAGIATYYNQSATTNVQENPYTAVLYHGDLA